MSKFSLLIIISFSSRLISGQVYYPFPTDSASWCFEFKWGGPDEDHTTYFNYEYKLEDTVTIGGKLYHNVSLFHLSEVSWSAYGYYYGGDDTDYNMGLVGAIREEGKKIYFYKYDLPGAPEDNLWMEENNQEYLLYDFNLMTGDSIKFSPCLDSYSIITETDSILLNDGLYHRKLSLFDRDGGNHFWVEGIGDLTGLLGSYVCVFEGSSWELYNTKINDEFVYFKYNCAYGEVSIHDQQKSEFEIYPNPAQDYFQIKSTQIANNSLLAIYDLYGNKQISQILNHSDEFIDIRNLPSGIYLIFISEGDKIYSKGLLNKI